MAVSFNTAKAPEPPPGSKTEGANLRAMSLTQRRKWMNDEQPGTYRPEFYRVSLSSSQRHFDDAIKQIAGQLMSDGYKPVVIDEPDPIPEATAPDRLQVAGNPPASHLTLADVETLSRLVAVPPRARIRTHKGVLGSIGIPTLRRHAAIAAHVMAEIDQTSRDNPALTNLVTNESAHAVVALSGGTATGARQAGEEILFDYSSYKTDIIVAEAKAHLGVGYGRRNAAAALKLLAQNKSPSIGPGRLDIVARGILRLAGRNLILANALHDLYQELSRANGRIDRWLVE